MKKSANKIPENFQEEEAKGITVTQRCEISPGARRGEVKFVGKVPELGAGYWVAVQLDEPMGDSNGTVKGKQYFEAVGGIKYGQFVRPSDVKVGDYPPTDDFNADDDEI